MKVATCFVSLVFGSSIALAQGESVSQVVDISDSKSESLSAQEICARLVLSSDLYVFDTTGARIQHVVRDSAKVRAGGMRGAPPKPKDGYMCRLQNVWSSESSYFEGIFVVKTEVKVDKEGKISGFVEQYADSPKDHEDAVPGGPKLKNLLKREEFAVKDLSPLTWPSVSHKKERVVMRMSFDLADEQEPEDIKDLVVAGEDVTIFDEQARVWAARSSATGKFVGFRTTQGTIFLSYYPFRRSTVVGFAKENTMELKLDGRHVTVLSRSSLLPPRMAVKVYGYYDKEKKTKDLKSSGTFSTDKEENFIKRMDN